MYIISIHSDLHNSKSPFQTAGELGNSARVRACATRNATKQAPLSHPARRSSFTQELVSKRPCLTLHGVVGSRQALHPRPAEPPCRARRRSARRRRGGHGR